EQGWHTDVAGIVLRFTGGPIRAQVLEHAVRRAEHRWGLLRANRIGRPSSVGPLFEPVGRDEISLFILTDTGQPTLLGGILCHRPVRSKRPTPADDRPRGENP